MKTAPTLALLALLGSIGLSQEPEGWRRNDSGRTKVLLGPKEDGEESPSVVANWSSPSVYGESISIITYHGKLLGASREEYRILGVEGDTLKLQLKLSLQRPPEKGLRIYSEATLSIPKQDGVFVLYTSDTIGRGFGFRITPNIPKAGVINVELFWDKPVK